MTLLNNLKFGYLALAISSVGLASCAYDGASRNTALTAAPATNGPAADYPMLIGDSYQINGVTYRPSDSLNYDHVGYAILDSAGGTSITAAHHTMPVPSYVEVTSLDTGRTILVRIERRGPMESNDLIALSAGALDQLGARPGVGVRVRRVNPPEQQRALLRSGQQANLRMDTPQSLLDVLKQRLPPKGSASLLSAEQDVNQQEAAPRKTDPVQAVAAPQPSTIVKSPEGVNAAKSPPPLPPANSQPTEAPVAKSTDGFAEAFREKTTAKAVVQPLPSSTPEPKAAPAKTSGRFMVQAATFSTMERAQNAAKQLGAHVNPAGKYFLMQMGPFGSPSEAQASLAKVKAAGYSDARIFTRSK